MIKDVITYSQDDIADGRPVDANEPVAVARGMKLLCSGRDVVTIFDLLGDKENDMTFGLGWVLSNSDQLLRGLVEDLTGQSWAYLADSVVKLQTSRVQQGITDIEIDLGHHLAIIFEAKRGAELPTEAQLQKYAAVLRASTATRKVLVALTNATATSAALVLNEYTIKGVEVLHRSWREVKTLVESAVSVETNANKRWLRSFTTYLEGLLKMERRFENWTYVVSLGGGTPDGWGIGWIDIVKKHGRYFYPVGKGGWPDPPPNYLAFRYKGQLQSIHHVDGFEVFTDPHTMFQEIPSADWGPHYCVKLGPALVPTGTIKNGPRVNQSARVWCMIDTLLTSATISDALTESERRSK